jgi:hypothetical protein
VNWAEVLFVLLPLMKQEADPTSGPEDPEVSCQQEEFFGGLARGKFLIPQQPSASAA